MKLNAVQLELYFLLASHLLISQKANQTIASNFLSHHAERVGKLYLSFSNSLVLRDAEFRSEFHSYSIGWNRKKTGAPFPQNVITFLNK